MLFKHVIDATLHALLDDFTVNKYWKLFDFVMFLYIKRALD